MNPVRDELHRRWEIAGPEIAEDLEQVKSKTLEGINQTDTHHQENNTTHNAIIRKNYATVIGRLLPINPFLENSFSKIRVDVKYSVEVCALVDTAPEVCQQQYKEFVDILLIKCKNPVSHAIIKNNFITSAKSIERVNPKEIPHSYQKSSILPRLLHHLISICI